MNKATEIYLAVGLDKAPAIRKAAALAAYDYWMEMVAHGEFEPYCNQITRLMKRFRLGDWMTAISANFPLSHKPR